MQVNEEAFGQMRRAVRRTASYSQAHEANCVVFAHAGFSRFRKNIWMQIFEGDSTPLSTAKHKMRQENCV
jgi:hypothetical protein